MVALFSNLVNTYFGARIKKKRFLSRNYLQSQDKENIPYLDITKSQSKRLPDMHLLIWKCSAGPDKWLVKGNISVIHQWMPLAQVISVIQGSIYIRDTLAGLGINTNAKNHLILSLKFTFSKKTKSHILFELYKSR